MNTAAAREAANAHEEIALAPLATVTSPGSKQCSPEVKTGEEEQDVSLPPPPATKIGLAFLLALHLSRCDYSTMTSQRSYDETPAPGTPGPANSPSTCF